MNPITGQSTLVYAHHDTGSQATLISDNLIKELGLETVPDPTITLRTLVDQKVASGGPTNFKLESLFNGEQFAINDALVVPQFNDDKNTLPHAEDTSALEHFDGVEIPVAPERERVDVLIGQSDKALLTVQEKREDVDPEEPKFVLTRLGPVASGGRVSSGTNALSILKVVVEPMQSCDCNQLKHEIVLLKEAVREYELQDEVLQASRTDELARSLVQPNIKVVHGRYEMPVPLKLDMIDKLPDNYENALKRTLALRTKAMRNPDLYNVLSDAFAELVAEGWMEPVGTCPVETPVWYLPFFVTRTDKPRVVYDGAAMVNGMSLNQLVLAGENLLNNLVEVLIRFRLGRYACVADVSKCFFQEGIPSDQQNLFRIVWFNNNALDKGEPLIFKFTRHV